MTNPVIPPQAVEAALAADRAYKSQRSMDNAEKQMRAVLEAAVAHIVTDSKAAAMEEVADHIAKRVEAGDTAPVTPADTIAWLRERARDLRKSTGL